MDILIILFLIFLGVLLLLLEFAVIPGITVAGIAGGLLLIASIYLAFDSYGVWAGLLTTLFVVIAVPILFLRFFKGRTGRKMILESEIESTVNETETADIKAGDTGKSVGRLAPVGKVRIHNKVFEGKSLQGFIDEEVDVEVVEVLKTQIVVKPIKQE